MIHSQNPMIISQFGYEAAWYALNSWSMYPRRIYELGKMIVSVFGVFFSWQNKRQMIKTLVEYKEKQPELLPNQSEVSKFIRQNIV